MNEVPQEPRLSSTLVLLLAFLPLTVEWAYKVFVYPRPFWIFYYDPETIYFYGGLQLLNLQMPSNVDNPGIPVHILSALLSTSTDSPFDLDQFRLRAYVVSWLLTLAAGYLSLRTLLVDLPPVLQIAGLWTYYLCPQSLEYTNVWGPETLYFPAGVTVLATVWTGYRQGLAPKRATWIGVAIGLACALKFAFLAWAAAIVFTVSVAPPQDSATRIRLVGAIVGGGILGFVATTCVVAPRYGYMLDWLWKLGSRSGPYGAGEAGIPAVSILFTNLLETVRSSKGWYLWLSGSLGWLACQLWSLRRRGRQVPRFAVGLGCFAVCALVLSHLMMARHMALHYLLPVGLCGLLLFSLCSRLALARRPAWLQVAVLLFGGVLLGKHLYGDVLSHRHRIAEGEAERAGVDQALQNLATSGQAPVVVYGFRASRPSFALRINTTDPAHHAIISREFPNEGHLSWDRSIVLPSGKLQWDYLVLDSSDDLRNLPEPVGPVLAKPEGFQIVAAPR
jgi:hypothetical protein